MNTSNVFKHPAPFADDLELADTPAKLRAYFINKSKKIIDEYIGAALGTSELNSTNSDARKETWSLLKDILSSAGDISKLEAQSTADILTLLKSGAITLQDAEKLMSIMTRHIEATEVAELKQMLEKMPSK